MSSQSRIPVRRSRSAPPRSVDTILEHHTHLLQQHTRMLEHLLATTTRLHAAMPAILAAERAKAVAETITPIGEAFCRAQTKHGKQCGHPLGREPSYVEMGEQRWPVCGPHAKAWPKAVFDEDGAVVELPKQVASE